MRIYVAADVDLLQRLRAGERVVAPAFTGDTEDEEDEYAALEEAAASSRAALAADVVASEDGFTLEQVASFHVDLDGTGDLAWFATQELDDVLAELQRDS